MAQTYSASVPSENGHMYLNIELSDARIGSSNSTRVYYKVYVHRTAGYYHFNNGNFIYIVLNGALKANGNPGRIWIDAGQTQVIHEGSVDVHHSWDGSGSCSVYVQFSQNQKSNSTTVISGTYPCTKINWSYRLTFEPNDGELPKPGGNLYNQTNPSNQVLVTIGYSSYYAMSNDRPTREGYTFNGWFDNVGKQMYLYNKDGSIIANPDNIYWTRNNLGDIVWWGDHDTTVYAKWIPNTYNLIINLNNDSGNVINLNKALTYDSLSYSSLASYIPERIGYKFLGFFDEDGNKVYDEDGVWVESDYWKNGQYKGTKDLKVIAQWKIQNVSYIKTDDNNYHLSTVSFKLEDGIWHSAILYTKTEDSTNSWKQSIV